MRTCPRCGNTFVAGDMVVEVRQVTRVVDGEIEKTDRAPAGGTTYVYAHVACPVTSDGWA